MLEIKKNLAEKGTPSFHTVQHFSDTKLGYPYQLNIALLQWLYLQLERMNFPSSCRGSSTVVLVTSTYLGHPGGKILKQ